MDNKYELTHHGVVGMKWGVRRFQRKDGSLTPAGKKRARSLSDDAKEAAAIKKKRVSQMSNAELQKLNQRNQLEIQYRDLKRKQNKGERAVNEFIKTGATVTAVVGAAVVYKKYGSKALQAIGNAFV